MKNLSASILAKLKNFSKDSGLDHALVSRLYMQEGLLTETSYTIREISQKVGYRSTRHFTNLFVKFTRDYPSRFRKE